MWSNPSYRRLEFKLSYYSGKYVFFCSLLLKGYNEKMAPFVLDWRPLADKNRTNFYKI